MKKKKEAVALSISEVKDIIEAYSKLEDKAQEILDAGECGCDDITGIYLSDDGKSVEIAYWTSCRGESYVEYKNVPIEWFGKGDFEDLVALWKEKREADKKAAEKAAKKEARWIKAQMKRKEFAELKRLKAKYPDA